MAKCMFRKNEAVSYSGSIEYPVIMGSDGHEVILRFGFHDQKGNQVPLCKAHIRLYLVCVYPEVKVDPHNL